MHYFIDGYNLLFRILHTGEDLKAQRESLIEDLAKKINLLGLDATLVFDSHFQSDPHARSHFNRLEIVYTSEGETADEYIIGELKSSQRPQEQTVVTSDKKLSWICRRRLGNTESVEQFIEWLNRRYKNKLRSKKTLPKTHSPPAVKPLPELPPSKYPTAEACYHFYLETFKKRAEELLPPKPLQKESPSRKRKQKPPRSNEESTLSDMQRWQNAFEKELENPQDFFF